MTKVREKFGDADVASFDETLEFCNKVRKAGGGDLLSALMPGIPEDDKHCLIAKNLNFDCTVTCMTFEESGWGWGMATDSKEEMVKISKELDLSLELPVGETYTSKVTPPLQEWIVLPHEIGLVAEFFDRWSDNPEDYKEFEPYVHESYKQFKKEADDLAAGEWANDI